VAIAITRPSCSDSLITASRGDGVFGSDIWDAAQNLVGQRITATDMWSHELTCHIKEANLLLVQRLG
jgi:predicted RNA-binding protein